MSRLQALILKERGFRNVKVIRIRDCKEPDDECRAPTNKERPAFWLLSRIKVLGLPASGASD